METILIASLLTCSQAQWIAEGALKSAGMTAEQRIEIVQRVQEQAEEGCEFEGFSDEST
jgi:hypothetical protein